MRVELHADADGELLDAARWYDDRRVGLGAELIEEVGCVLERISDAPESFPSWRAGRRLAGVRKASLRRFPYLVAYEILSDAVFVWAIAHAKRRPLYWLSRRRRDPR